MIEERNLLNEIIEINKNILNENEMKLIELLINNNQEHLFLHWNNENNNEKKKNFLKQLKYLHESYLPLQEGLISYIKNAKKLLNDSKNGVNPLNGWIPSIPNSGISIEPMTETYLHYDNIGKEQIGSLGFILVAGGLGERLGYSGIKISLPTETLTNISYIELYCKQIIAIQNKYAPNRTIPFAIMVSDDTHDRTKELLELNNNFGFELNQITLIKQDKVAALLDNDARIALEEHNQYQVNCKPHGHGDVHSLLYQTGLAKEWYNKYNVKWLFFFQDTNALALNSLSAMLGVSIELNLHMNSRAIPRYAKQAVGGLVRLINEETKQEMTVNVEYNQLDPLLRTTISPEGDVNDPITGQSIFPGNINQLLIHLEDYLKVIEKNHGVMNEFVNPKYSDETRTKFKKPTRLECMMQDYSYALQSTTSTSTIEILNDEEKGNEFNKNNEVNNKENNRVGFTLSPGWSCYSPVKNHVNDARLVKNGVPPACALTGECDEYFMWKELLRKNGSIVEEGEIQTIQGISGILNPQVVFHPSFILFPFEFSLRFPYPNQINITSNSSLYIEGENIVIESLYLDGALKIINKSSSSKKKHLIIQLTNENIVRNKGIKVIPLTENELQSNDFNEVTKMRGFQFERIQEHIIEINDDNDDEENDTYVINDLTERNGIINHLITY